MALLYLSHRALFILILLATCGSALADEVATENNRTGTTRSPTTVQLDTSSDNTTEPATTAENQLPDDNATQSASSDNITENPTDKPSPAVITTQKTVIETTQNPINNEVTTQKSKDEVNNVTQSSDKATDGIEKQSKGPGGVTSNKGHVGSTKKNTGADITTQFIPVTFDTRWMDIFIHTHHFEGQYSSNDVRYLFDFVVRYKHPDSPRTLVTFLYDADGAVLEFNGTSPDNHLIVFTLSKIYTPGVRFPLHQPLEITGTFTRQDQPYFTGNFTKPINSSFAWFHMNKGLGTIETGETAGTKTAIVIIIPTSIAFLGICGTVAIICWASKKGYLRGRHKSYRLFTDAQVSYESEAETIHI